MTIKVNNKVIGSGAAVETDASASRVETGRAGTSTNAVTTVWSWEMPDDTVACLDITLVGRRRGTAGRALFRRSVIVYREAGTVTVGSPDTIGTDVESTGGYDITVDNSGATVRVRATGANSHTMRWASRVVITSVG